MLKRSQLGVLAIAINQALAADLSAATITVDSAADNGVGCTLRDAITTANTDQFQSGCTTGSGADTIVFDSAITGQTITLSGGPLVIESSLTIEGSGVQQTVVSGGDLSRIFDVDDGEPAAIDVVIKLLTVTDGLANDSNTPPEFGGGPKGLFGGGIFNRESLTLSDVRVTGNYATWIGGGIANRGSLLMVRSEVSDNYAGELSVGGGGLFNDSSARLVDTSVTLNQASNFAPGIMNLADGELRLEGSVVSANGGRDNNGSGIFNNGSATINRSTISGNTASTGGGILNNGQLVVRASVLFGNSADSNGGAILSSGPLTIENSTISGNTATSGSAIRTSADTALVNVTITENESSDDAAYAAIQTTGGLSVLNTIGANNTGGNCISSMAPTTSAFLSDDGSCGADIVADAVLGPLADNGGTTLTHALLAGSPAINAGNPAICDDLGSIDQRGYSRDAACDIGAFEFGSDFPEVIFADGFEPAL